MRSIGFSILAQGTALLTFSYMKDDFSWVLTLLAGTLIALGATLAADG